MSQESADKDGTETVTIARVARVGGGRFAPGGPGGPGRPRRGETRAEQVRRNVDWEAADAEMVAIMHDRKQKASDRIAAYLALNDRGWGKALSSHDLHVSSSSETSSRYDVDALNTEQARQLLDIVERAELTEGDG